MLSSLNDECKSDNYIEPHYKEWYRVAVDTLIEHGLDAYKEFLAKERVSDFLAEEEINYILKNVQKVAQSTSHGPDNSCDDASSSGTYWPVESDVEAPNLDLGWPYVMPGLLGGTHIELLFHPPRAQLLTIKETIRKMIKEARKVIFLSLDERSETLEITRVVSIQQSPAILASGTSFVEDRFSTDQGRGGGRNGLGMI